MLTNPKYYPQKVNCTTFYHRTSMTICTYIYLNLEPNGGFSSFTPLREIKADPHVLPTPIFSYKFHKSETREFQIQVYVNKKLRCLRWQFMMQKFK